MIKGLSEISLNYDINSSIADLATEQTVLGEVATTINKDTEIEPLISTISGEHLFLLIFYYITLSLKRLFFLTQTRTYILKRRSFMLNYTTLEDFVEETYKDIGILFPKEIDMAVIARHFGVRLAFWDETSEAVEDNGEFWIFLNEELGPKEQWQDFAHELCHVLQHEGYQLSMGRDFILYQEIKADNFMYNFCIPTFMLENYQIANYYNIEDGVSIISRDFNVTEEFSRKRLIQFRNKIQQARLDEEHREFMQSLYPKAPPYSNETMKVMEELSSILHKKGL